MRVVRVRTTPVDLEDRSEFEVHEREKMRK